MKTVGSGRKHCIIHVLLLVNQINWSSLQTRYVLKLSFNQIRTVTRSHTKQCRSHYILIGSDKA